MIKKYIEFFFQLLVHKYLINQSDKIKKVEDLKSVLNNFKKFKTKLSKDKDLKTYQKIFGLIQYNYISIKYDCWNTYYIKIKEIEENSILNQAIQFYKNFISDLEEESPVFFKLLEINSKYGYFQNSQIYNFSLLNLQDIKEHFLELIPEVIYFFDCDCKIKSFVFSMTGELAINEKLLFEKYDKMSLIKNYEVKDKCNAENISMTIARYLLHEECGHSKYRNKSDIKRGIKSPIKCISEGKIKTMTYICDKNKSSDLIKIFSADKNGKGDSGHYMETAFGKWKDVYCIIFFDIIKNVGKLLKYPKYFILKEYLPILQKYLFLKYLIEKNEIEMTWYENISIETENVLMIKLLKNVQSNKLQKSNLDEKNKSVINSPKKNEKSEDEPTGNKLEENEYESSFTEENVLKVLSYSIDSNEEIETRQDFLRKKRKKEDIKEENESKKPNTNIQQKDYTSNLIYNENEIKENNLDSLDSDMEVINQFAAEIKFEYRFESDDDEASI